MATLSLKELLEQKAALEQQIQDLQQTSRAEAIAEVKRIMAEAGLTVSDLGQQDRAAKPSKVTGTKVAAKYRDPSSGASWTGRGLKPRWLTTALDSGKKLEDFLLEK